MGASVILYSDSRLKPGIHWRVGPGLNRFLLPLLTCLVLSMPLVRAVSLEELRNDPRMSPSRFASYFADFKYQFLEEVQPPELFLATRIGDCDDFATLAAMVLREKGFRTHLIAIRMPGLVHVVCYVEEIKGYLDFNNRSFLKRTVSCNGTLRDIARSVAKSFEANWTSASEFTFQNGLKYLVSTIAQVEAYSGNKPAPSGLSPGAGADFVALPLR